MRRFHMPVGIKCAGAGFLAEVLRVESGSEPMHLKLLL